MCYEDGSMLDLHTNVTDEEWKTMVTDTVKYKVFVECLKETAMPILGERWEEEDDWFRVQLEIAVSRMRNIDPLLVASFDQTELTKSYSKKMQTNAKEVQGMVEDVREARKTAFTSELDGDNDITPVSDL